MGPSFPLLQIFLEGTFSILHQCSHHTTCLGEPSVSKSETLSLRLTHINHYFLRQKKKCFVEKTVEGDRNLPLIKIQHRQLWEKGHKEIFFSMHSKPTLKKNKNKKNGH